MGNSAPGRVQWIFASNQTSKTAKERGSKAVMGNLPITALKVHGWAA